MSSQKLEPLLLKLTKFGLYLALLTPFIAWDQVIYPFIFPKIIYFRILIEIIFILYFILWSLNRAYAPKITSLGLLILLSIAIISFTSIMGENPYRSFFSTVIRGEGVITYLHLAAFFFILTSVIKTQDEWLSILSFASLVFFLENALAFGQIWKFPFLKMFGTNRPSGTFGNPAFYASFMLFGLWLSVFLLEKKSSFQRPFFRVLVPLNILSIIFGLFALYKTENRGGTLALFLSVIILLSIFLLSRIQILKKLFTKKSLVVLGIVLAAFLLLISFDRTLRELVYYRFNEPTIKNRFITWEIGWKGFLDRPFLGHGNENYYIVFEKYFNPSIIRDRGSFPWYDRAHNAFIDILVANGIIGIMAHLGIFFAAFYTLLRSDLRKPQKFALSGAMLSYAIQNFFLFDTLSALIFFYFFLAYINSFQLARAEGFITRITELFHNFLYKPKHVWLKIIPGITVFFAIFYFWNLAPLQAAYFASRFAIESNLPIDEVQKNFQKAFFLSSPKNNEYRKSLGNYIINPLQRGEDMGKYQKIIPVALRELDKSVKADPFDIQTRYILTELARLVSPANPPLLQLAEYHSVEIIKRSPLRYQGYFALAKVRDAQGRTNEGIQIFREVLKFQPNFLPAYFNIAIFLILDGRYDEAKAALDEISARRDFFIYEKANIHLIAKAFIEKKQYERAIKLYQEAINNFDEALEKNYEQAISLYGNFSDYFTKLIELEEKYGTKNVAGKLRKKLELLEKDFNGYWGGKKLPNT